MAPIRSVLHALPPTIATLMIPGFVGVIEAITTPFLPVRTIFEMPGPVIFTVAPATAFEPFFTVTLTFWCLPCPRSIFGVAASVWQISGVGLGVGFGVGGVAGAVTSVLAEAVLLFGFVSGGVVLLITTTFVFVPAAATVALIVIGTDSPGASVGIVQSIAWADVAHEPLLIEAETNVTSAGPAPETCTFCAVSGPLFFAAIV